MICTKISCSLSNTEASAQTNHNGHFVFEAHMHAAFMCDWLVIFTNSWKATEKQAVNLVGLCFYFGFCCCNMHTGSINVIEHNVSVGRALDWRSKGRDRDRHSLLAESLCNSVYLRMTLYPLLSIVLVLPSKTHSDMNENLLTGT